jgi:hypothetical protein
MEVEDNLNLENISTHGVGGSNPVFSEIGNLRNFSLYTAKIVFFDHTQPAFALCLSEA